jgi:hypothetical protein
LQPPPHCAAAKVTIKGFQPTKSKGLAGSPSGAFAGAPVRLVGAALVLFDFALMLGILAVLSEAAGWCLTMTWPRLDGDCVGDEGVSARLSPAYKAAATAKTIANDIFVMMAPHC